MKSTKRLLCLLLFAAMVLSLFAGCGVEGEETYAPSDVVEDTAAEAATEPLSIEIQKMYEDGFYIGDSVRFYDDQGNLFNEKYDFRYQDGSTKVGYNLYDTNGIEIESHYNCYDINGNNTEGFFAEHFADGTRKSNGAMSIDE